MEAPPSVGSVEQASCIAGDLTEMSWSSQKMAEQPFDVLVFRKPILDRIRLKIPNTWSRESDFARSWHNLNVSYLISSFNNAN